MERCVITIRMDYAAFEEDPNELPRLLEELAEALSDAVEPMAKKLFDVNGNRVGNCVIS